MYELKREELEQEKKKTSRSLYFMLGGKEDGHRN